MLRRVSFVHRREERAGGPLPIVGNRFGGSQVIDGRTPAAKHNALMARGEKPVGPVDRAAGGKTAGIGNDDVGGQVVAFRAETVRQPRAEHGESVQAKSGVLLKRRRRMVGSFGEHRLDDSQFVGNLGDVRKEFRNPQAALASLFELPIVFPQQADLPEEDVGLLARGHRPAMIPRERRLVVE